jgi:Pentapeptide repeats (8 copies)
MKYEIKRRNSNKVQFVAEIVCKPDATENVKTGLSARWGYERGADLRGVNLSGADLCFAKMTGANLIETDLSASNLNFLYGNDVNLKDANLVGADLSYALLNRAYLANADMRQVNLQGTKLKNACLNSANLSDSNLSQADLSNANLSETKLYQAKLDSTNLSGSSISSSYFYGAQENSKVIDADSNIFRRYKADLWLVLSHSKKEVPYLLKALKQNRINGSKYKPKNDEDTGGLLGTIAYHRGIPYEEIHSNVIHPAIVWFYWIGSDSDYRCHLTEKLRKSITIQWIEEWCILMGVT